MYDHDLALPHIRPGSVAMSTVSLAGKLEDLGLSDILQILALSRKSGVLRLRSGELGLDLFVRSGNVAAARPAPSIATLHRFFAEKRLLDERRHAAFVQVLRDKSFRVEPWSEFWSAVFELPVETMRSWAERYLVWLVAMGTAWGHGEFSFELDSAGDALRKITQVPVFPYVPDGLSAQYLAMESARISDESIGLAGDTGPAVDEQTITGTLPDAAVPALAERLLIVEDTADVADRVAQALRARGFPRVEVAYSVQGAIDAVEQAEGSQWIVVSDLVMPKRDRSGVLGGLEVAQVLSGHPRVAEVYLCSDLVSPEIREQATAAGARGFITRPGRKQWKTDAVEALRRFVEGIATAIGPVPDKPAAAPPAAPPPPPVAADPAPTHAAAADVDADDPLAALLGEGDFAIPAPRTAQGMELLRQMIEELVNPNAEGEVTLLVLRYAADLFQRAVLMAVTDDAFIALGEVGLDQEAALRVRGARLERGAGDVLDEVAARGRPWVGSPGNGPSLRALTERMGGPQPQEIFVGPVLAGGRIVAMLYADQVPTTLPIRDVETLEIFLGQAGMAIERAYLRRQLRELDRRKDS
jgi:CheY-like chemotaxis protein